MLNSRKVTKNCEYQLALLNDAKRQIKVKREIPLMITLEGHVLRKNKEKFTDVVNYIKKNNENFLIGYYYAETVKQVVGTGKIVEQSPTIEVNLKIQFNNIDNTFKDLIYYFTQACVAMNSIKEYLYKQASSEVCVAIHFDANTSKLKSELLYDYMGENSYVKNLNQCKYSKIDKNYFQAVTIKNNDICFEIEGSVVYDLSIEEVAFHILNEIYSFNNQFIEKIEGE